ncbi:hypothetical protein [Spirosoma pulveris]
MVILCGSRAVQLLKEARNDLIIGFTDQQNQLVPGDLFCLLTHPKTLWLY